MVGVHLDWCLVDDTMRAHAQMRQFEEYGVRPHEEYSAPRESDKVQMVHTGFFNSMSCN